MLLKSVLILSSVVTLGVIALLFRPAGIDASEGNPVEKLSHFEELVGEIMREWTDEQWKEHLSEGQFQVLRNKRTERAWTSPLLKEDREGVFACAACGTPLFSSESKYDSRTGWPSFWMVIEEGVIEYTEDRSWGMRRTAVACAKCGGHLGHVFEDGPQPTGMRYCINGLALVFIEKSR